MLNILGVTYKNKKIMSEIMSEIVLPKYYLNLSKKYNFESIKWVWCQKS